MKVVVSIAPGIECVVEGEAGIRVVITGGGVEITPLADSVVASRLFAPRHTMTASEIRARFPVEAPDAGNPQAGPATQGDSAEAPRAPRHARVYRHDVDGPKAESPPERIDADVAGPG